MLIPDHEKERLHALIHYETEARDQGYHLIAGIDEAGRGPLAGPVVAAACIIPEGVFLPGINDSKQLTPKQRAALFKLIIETKEIVYGIGIIDAGKIDQINIFQATIQAMLLAVKNLSIQPHYLLVDGLKLPHPTLPSLKIIKGDTKSQSIAAASVIAKETRDLLMLEYHKEWPHYGFDRHKGYGTAKHQEAIELHGACPIHRLTFQPLKDTLLS